MQRLIGAALVVFVAACSHPTHPPRYLSLLAEPMERGGSWVEGMVATPGVGVTPEPDGSGVRIDYEILPHDWRSDSNGWLAVEVPHGHEPGDLELQAGGEARRFILRAGRLHLRAAEAPSSATLRCLVQRTRPGIYGGTLEPLWPGEQLTWTVEVPPDSELSFQTLTLGARAAQIAGGLRLEVVAQASTVAALEVGATLAGGLAHHRVPLPPGKCSLRLGLAGAPVPLWLVSPRIGPRRADSWRAEAPARPDILVFLADTFRADLLAAYGGRRGVTPRLDALACQSRRFLAARSTSTWTLPAHASLFTGLWPAQHGAETPARTFDPGLVTLTEALHAAGYRTGAVTDGGYVTRAHGFDAGFEWFREVQVRNGARLQDTFAAADSFLAADDGRPVFLFVQTYRVHTPYRSEEGRLPTEFHALNLRLREEQRGGKSLQELEKALLPPLRELYEGGARDLDRQLGEWIERLKSEQRFERGLLVFTSDHGEAFLEHGEVYHTHAPHEEQVRIPLLLYGAGIEPGDVPWGASLIDLFPTLARLAGADQPAPLPGRDLLALEDERMLFASVHHEGIHSLAAILGAQKLLASHTVSADFVRDGRALYDLTGDPGETIDLLRSASAGAFAAQAARAYATASVPSGSALTLELEPDNLEALQALGYGD